MPAESLDALRRTLDSFRITACGVSHERVILESGRAQRRHANGVVSSFVRVGLCPWDDRNVALACAHTMARHRLIDAAEALAEQGLMGRDEAHRIADQITQSADIIHAVDWSKGELEAAYAVAVESGDLSKTAAIRAQIERLESEHTAALRQLQAILQRVRRVAGCADERPVP